MALKRDMMVPKDEMIKIIRSAEPPDFTLNDDPQGVLARDQTPRPQTGAV